MTFIESVLGDHDLAQKVGEALLSSPFTIMLRVDDEAFDEAWGRFKSERGLSFTDCSSFASWRGTVWATPSPSMDTSRAQASGPCREPDTQQPVPQPLYHFFVLSFPWLP
jgi:hypothetical protein